MQLAAPTYVDYVMTWVQNLLDDENIFPTKSGTSNSAFPSVQLHSLIRVLVSRPTFPVISLLLPLLISYTPSRPRVLTELPLDRQARLPPASARLRSPLPRALPADPASPLRGPLQLSLRTLPRLRQGVRAPRPQGYQGPTGRARRRRRALGEVEGDGHSRVLVNARSSFMFSTAERGRISVGSDGDEERG